MPGKLHNTTWGFLCPAETPEGQSIGVVKALSYRTHITIPTNSACLYEYVEPHIDKVENTTVRTQRKMHVVNGSWIGITDPYELYESMKEKKHKGIINIYTSIIMDCENAEIRICSDGGRLTRPVREERWKVLITQDIIDKLRSKSYVGTIC